MQVAREWQRCPPPDSGYGVSLQFRMQITSVRCWAICLVVGASLTAGAQQHSYTWQQIKDKFEATNPTLLADKLNIDEAKAEEITAYFRPNPDFNLTVDGTQIAPHNGVWQPFAGTFESPGISYLHERRHKRELRLESAKKGTLVAEFSHSDLERTLLFTLRGAFVSTLQSKAVVQLAKDNLAYYDHVLEISRNRFAAGDIAQIDLDRLELQRVQYESDLQTAEANLNLAKITADRYTGLLKTDSVSKQDADNAQGNYAAQKATVQSAEANVKRLEQLQSFEKIYAPFDGVITARNTDIGVLIDSGSSGGVRTELFHIAQPDKLRVYVNVPEIYAPASKVGLQADLVLSEFPGRRFPGTLVRTANAIDQSTRTLLVEIRVNNPTGNLLSGAYAEVHLKLPNAVSSFILPVNTLIFRSEGLQVASVPDGQHVDLKPITIGHDYGTQVEVVSGLAGDESIIINPPDSIVAGQQVRIVGPASGEPQSAGSQTKSEH